MSENKIQSEVMRELGSMDGVRIFRNHTGTVKDVRGQWHNFGLFKGSADLIGWVKIKGVAVFLSVEVKSAKGRLRPEQANWQTVVKANGGIALVVHSAEEAKKALAQTLESFSL